MTLVHLLEKWYQANPSIKPHPALMDVDKGLIRELEVILWAYFF